jgi:hypothetical protein
MAQAQVFHDLTIDKYGIDEPFDITTASARVFEKLASFMACRFGYGLGIGQIPGIYDV